MASEIVKNRRVQRAGRDPPLVVATQPWGRLNSPVDSAPINKERRLTEPVTTISPDARPRLPRGVRLVQNEAQGGWVLLAPERVFKADAIAAEIIKRCTGEATFAAIIDDLVNTFSAPRERIVADVSMILRTLADRKLLEL
jgi:pyrroloquinoline quinone biosynthesis protein D